MTRGVRRRQTTPELLCDSPTSRSRPRGLVSRDAAASPSGVRGAAASGHGAGGRPTPARPSRRGSSRRRAMPHGRAPRAAAGPAASVEGVADGGFVGREASVQGLWRCPRLMQLRSRGAPGPRLLWKLNDAPSSISLLCAFDPRPLPLIGFLRLYVFLSSSSLRIGRLDV